MAVWIALAVFAVLSVGGVGAWALMSDGDGVQLADGSGEAADPSAPRPAVAPPFPDDYLPEDADVFIHLRFAEAWNDPLVAGLLPPQARMFVDSLAAADGITLADVESVTLAGPFLDGVVERTKGQLSSGSALPPSTFENPVAVVRLSQDFSVVDMASAKGSEGEKRFTPLSLPDAAGEIYVDRTETPVGQAPRAVWQPDARTVVIGDEERIVALASKPSGNSDRAAFAGAAGGTLQVFVAPKGGLSVLPTSEEMNSIADDEAAKPSEESVKRYDVMQRTAAGFGLSLDLTARPQTLTVTCPAMRPGMSEDVAELEAAADWFLAQLIEKSSDPDAAMPPNVRSLSDDLLGSADRSTTDGVVTVTFTAPADLRARLEAPPGE